MQPDQIALLKHDIARHVRICAELATENERLRTALRAIRASTSFKWQEQLISDALREPTP